MVDDVIPPCINICYLRMSTIKHHFSCASGVVADNLYYESRPQNHGWRKNVMTVLVIWNAAKKSEFST
jgi:hypothetical protein